MVPYAHLDTQWRWEFPQIDQRISAEDDARELRPDRKYPHYVFNWTGANRYRLMKEYFPTDYARMKQYVAQGRWFPAGSSMEEGDVNLPSAEGDHPPGALRQYLFPQGIRQGQRRVHAAGLLRLSRVAAQHSGARRRQGILHAEALGGMAARAAASAARIRRSRRRKAFPSTWACGKGPDGKTIIAALNPGGYGSTRHTDLSKEPPPPPPVDPNAQGGRGRGRGPRSRIGSSASISMAK